MKMFNISGELVNVDVRASKYPLKKISKSSLQGKTGDFLSENFPYDDILEDFTIPDSRLSIDFFMPKRRIIVEVQGEQHLEHVPFFHGDRALSTKYGEQQSRDRTKAGWAEINGYTLYEIITEKDLEKIK